MRKLLVACTAVILSFAAHGGVLFPIKPGMYVPPEDRKQIQCLADNVFFEARGEDRRGQIAVAMVTMNRVNSGQFADDVCGVVQQKVRSTCQFSWWCDVTLKTKAMRRQHLAEERDLYNKVYTVAIEVYKNHKKMQDVTKGAMFYHASYVSPGWKKSQRTVTIGQHVFYKDI